MFISFKHRKFWLKWQIFVCTAFEKHCISNCNTKHYVNVCNKYLYDWKMRIFSYYLIKSIVIFNMYVCMYVVKFLYV